MARVQLALIPIAAGIMTIITASVGISMHHTLTKSIAKGDPDPAENTFVMLIILLSIAIFGVIGGTALIFA